VGAEEEEGAPGKQQKGALETKEKEEQGDALEVGLLANGVAVGAAAMVGVVQPLLLVLGIHPEQAADLEQAKEESHVDSGPNCVVEKNGG